MSTGNKRKKYTIYFAAPVVAVLLVSTILYFTSDGDETETVSRSVQPAGIIDASAISGRESFASRYETACDPFSPEGAMCEVPTSCSGWIRNDPDLPAGSTYVIMPQLDQPGTPANQRVYRKIRYLDRFGIPRELKDGDFPSDVMAWEFCPRVPITMTYHAS